MKSPHDVIIRPVLTEKTYDGIPNKRYAFIVTPDANKIEIRQAIETIFEVKVDRVNTMNRLGKLKRQGAHIGRRPSTKKAYVTLKKDSKPIKFFENLGQ